MELERKYPIIHAERIATEFGASRLTEHYKFITTVISHNKITIQYGECSNADKLQLCHFGRKYRIYKFAESLVKPRFIRNAWEIKNPETYVGQNNCEDVAGKEFDTTGLEADKNCDMEWSDIQLKAPETSLILFI